MSPLLWQVTNVPAPVHENLLTSGTSWCAALSRIKSDTPCSQRRFKVGTDTPSVTKRPHRTSRVQRLVTTYTKTVIKISLLVIGVVRSVNTTKTPILDLPVCVAPYPARASMALVQMHLTAPGRVRPCRCQPCQRRSELHYERHTVPPKHPGGGSVQGVDALPSHVQGLWMWHSCAPLSSAWFVEHAKVIPIRFPGLVYLLTAD